LPPPKVCPPRRCAHVVSSAVAVDVVTVPVAFPPPKVWPPLKTGMSAGVVGSGPQAASATAAAAKVVRSFI